MFESGAEPIMFDGPLLVQQREDGYQRLHAEILSVGKQITALEARECDLFFDAAETGLYRRMGYATIHAYIQGVRGYTHHTATERMRVAYELLDLPQLHEQFNTGELPWTSVRELTRVVTPKTEDVWLDAIEGKRTDEVQAMVRGKSKGDLPTDSVDEKKLRYRIVLEDLTPEAYAMHKQARIAAAETNGGTCTDSELVMTYAKAVLAPAVVSEEPGKSPFQIAVTTCRSCKAASRVGPGMEVELTPEAFARAECDAELIGDLEREDRERLQTTIPTGTRRKVFVRDRFACTYPGCRSTRFLEAHHIKHRADGGGHEPWNLTLLCDAHHMQLHDGAISLSGRAPDRLVFARRPLPDEERELGPVGDRGEVSPVGD
jgi:hypothetical protein